MGLKEELLKSAESYAEQEVQVRRFLEAFAEASAKLVAEVRGYFDRPFVVNDVPNQVVMNTPLGQPLQVPVSTIQVVLRGLFLRLVPGIGLAANAEGTLATHVPFLKFANSRAVKFGVDDMAYFAPEKGWVIRDEPQGNWLEAKRYHPMQTADTESIIRSVFVLPAG